MAIIFITRKNKAKSKPTVLCLGRTIFLDDVKAMKQFSGQINYVVIHLKYWALIFNHLAKKDPDYDQASENGYHKPGLMLSGKKKYYDYLKKMFPYLLKSINFKCILSGNIGYIYQQEIANVCKEFKLPFVVLHKEGMDIFRDFEELYQGFQFGGSKAIFYNETIRRKMLETKIPGLSEDNTVVTGLPRLDFYFNHQKNNKPSNQIVFFSFFPDIHFSQLQDNPEKFTEAKKRTADFHRLIMEYAKNNKGKKVYIKTKNAEFYFDYVNQILEQNFPNEKIENLTITNSADPAHLIESSDTIISFNSTTLIEAMILNKLILSPDFTDLLTNKTWNYFNDYPSLVSYINNLTELEQSINNSANHAYPEEDRNNFLKFVIHTPDGQASKRVEAELLNEIKKYDAR
jgi:hypothetical protein